MITLKKNINKAKKYTKKREFRIYNSKILHNFYKNMLLKNKTQEFSLLNNNNNSITSKFLEHLYTQFNNNQKIINAINVEKSRYQETNKTIIKNKITTIVDKYLKSSKYIDISIINFIITNVYNCKIVSYKNTIKGKIYVFDFIIYTNKISMKKLDFIVEKMLLILQVLIAISNNILRNGQHVTFFLTPFKKKLNFNNNVILGAKNVNSGFTNPFLINGLTFIYRNEEFFKVFIHESIHYYGIDKALLKDLNSNDNYNKFINLFNITNKGSINIGINEGLTEFWTFIMYICSLSYKKEVTLPNFIYEVERLYKIELAHILFQLVKILNYNNLTYSQLLNKSNHKYSESSHIFSYYIVKTLLVYNIEDLYKSNIFDLNFSNNINICLKPDIISINKFLNILFKYALDTNFIKLVTKVTDFYNNYKNYKNENVNYKQEFILNNLRMMSSDYNIFL